MSRAVGRGKVGHALGRPHPFQRADFAFVGDSRSTSRFESAGCLVRGANDGICRYPLSGAGVVFGAASRNCSLYSNAPQRHWNLWYGLVARTPAPPGARRSYRPRRSGASWSIWLPVGLSVLAPSASLSVWSNPLLATRLLRSMLFGDGPADPIVLAVTSVGLVGLVVAASVIPTRRAFRIDPLEAMRSS
jgi:hypothetical protein